MMGHPGVHWLVDGGARVHHEQAQQGGQGIDRDGTDDQDQQAGPMTEEFTARLLTAGSPLGALIVAGARRSPLNEKRSYRQESPLCCRPQQDNQNFEHNRSPKTDVRRTAKALIC